MGQARLPAQAPERSANRFGLYLWRDLPEGGQRRGADHAALRDRAMNLHLAEIATQVAPHGHAAILLDQAGWRLSGGLKIPSNITLDTAACQMSRTQPARKHLAVHPRQLALKPHLQILRRHRRPLLPHMDSLIEPPGETQLSLQRPVAVIAPGQHAKRFVLILEDEDNDLSSRGATAVESNLHMDPGGRLGLIAGKRACGSEQLH